MKRWLALPLALMVLCGCAPVAREPDRLELVRVLGVDGASPVTLTAVCSSADGQTTGRGSAQAEGFPQARQQVVWSGTSRELALTGVSDLVLGSDADVEAVVFAVLEDATLGANIVLWAAEESAGGLLGACDDPWDQLERLTCMGVRAPTAAQAAAALESQGWVELPCLTACGERLEQSGVIRWTTDN